MNKPLILVVEDDPSVRNLITTTLKTNDYRYVVAPNGSAAIMEATSHNPEIILLDLGLPDMDGVQVIQTVRSWSNVPIIVISARSEDNDKIKALDAGADDYLTKPFSVEELLAPAKAYLPKNISGPAGAEDMETLRAAFRYNKTADCGFLFINNHQRKRKMTEKQITPEKPLQFTVTDVEGIQRQIIFDRIHVRTDAILVLPYNLPVVIRGEQFRLRKTNASYLGCFGGTYYFYTDEKPEDIYFEWSDGNDHAEAVRILTIHDAEHFCYAQEGADEKGKVSLLPDLHFAEAGKVRIADAGQAVESIWNVYGQTEPNVYELTLEYEYHPADALSGDVWLELDFGGDCARLYQDGKLLDDWFSNGELWRVALKRYGYPTKLTLELDPFKPDVYYDLPPKRENRLAGARLLRLS